MGRFAALRVRWGLLALPVIAVLLLAFGMPIASMTANSLFNHAGPGRVGSNLTLVNYINFATDPYYLGILVDTFALGFVVVSICTVLGYPVAYFLARTHSRWRGVLMFLVIAPLLVSAVIRNLGWIPLLGTNGFVNWALQALGLTDRPIALVNNFLGVVIGTTHALLPFMILMLTTVIQRINPQIEEAAVNLGATPWKNFTQVVLPLSMPGLIGGYLIVFTITISSYTTPAMLGGHRVTVMSTFVAQQIRFVLNYAFGATCAVVLMAVAIALTVMATRQSERGS
ncbi:MAG: ABC transporter permease [Alphaproteobacteria bacterium]|nr:ABC transporter permease [Alphaproteobacteria bacterium]